jgi:hypothetical protein
MAGSSVPTASTPTCQNCLVRPACGASARNIWPAYQTFHGSGPRSTWCSTAARITPAVPSGRSVSDRSPRSVNVYISLVTMSVDSPTRRKTPVSSKTGVST